VYVDALGATGPYEQLLSSRFPGINFTVTAKADSKYKIVGAASVAAKVTRDAWIEGWVFEEDAQESSDTLGVTSIGRTWSTAVGSGYPSGVLGLIVLSSPHYIELCILDPNTKTWVKDSLEKTFGYPSIARFSWSTIKAVLEDGAHAVEWYVVFFGGLPGLIRLDQPEGLMMVRHHL
jgi:ribonuclease H2 subunit A